MPVTAADMLLVALAYLIGSAPFGYLVARSRGVNLFEAGSGNVGATNVGRVLGRRFGYLVFGLDFVKGAFPAAVAAWWRGGADAVAVAAGFAAVLGHMYSAFLRFRGGKGVATGAGVMAVLLPVPAAFAALAFVAVLAGGRVMSLAAVAAAVVLAIAQVSMGFASAPSVTGLAVIAAALVVVRHRGNLARLAAGAEAPLKGLDAVQRCTPAAHALAVGLWCGAGWFFSLAVAPRVFATFDTLLKNPPDWLPLTDDTIADAGSRLAGAAVAPVFPTYFALQAVCGLIAAGTAVGWAVCDRSRRSLVRAVMLTFALALVAAGWPVVTAVNSARIARYEAKNVSATGAFWALHGVSVILNLAALALATPALALAAYPPRFDDHITLQRHSGESPER